MTKHIYTPIPYYQFVPNADLIDYATYQYTYLPNQKIHCTYPFIKIDRKLLNKPAMDIAVAEAPPDESASIDNDISCQDTTNDGVNNLAISTDTDNETIDSTSDSDDEIRVDLILDDKEKITNDKLLSCAITTNEHVEKTVESIKNAMPNDSSTTTEPSNSHINRENTFVNNGADFISDTSKTDPIQTNPRSFKTLEQPEPTDTTTAAQKDTKQDAVVPDSSIKHATQGTNKVEEDIEDLSDLNHEEKARAKKEAQLESYRQFVAAQQSKVEIDYAGIRVSIEANALPSRMYFIMNTLSAIIASYGLVMNSAAVVIGAMLVAMMLGPISGVALAMIDYRIPLLRKSLLTVLAGGILVVTIGYIIGYIHGDMALTNEILSRTQPSSMDLMVALAGGTAGAYAMTSPHLSVAVVGVAVATALVPPLAASGILFSHGEGVLGFGALLLAITNIIAIQFTNALVLWFTGFRRLVKDDYKTNAFVAFFKRNAVPLFLLTAVGVYLSYNFNVVTKRQKFESEVKETINDYFLEKGNALTATQFSRSRERQTVRALVRGEFRPSSYDAKFLENTISQRMQSAYPKYRPVDIQLRYIPVVVIDSSPKVNTDIDQTDVALLNSDSNN